MTPTTATLLRRVAHSTDDPAIAAEMLARAERCETSAAELAANLRQIEKERTK